MPRQAQDQRDGAIRPLICHLDTPPRRVEGVGVQLISADASSLSVEFSVRGGSHLILPAPAAAVRTDGLWRTTCFEAFLKPEGTDEYFELNFSPSFAWAAYRFEGYRAGMSNLQPRLPPEIGTSDRDRDLSYFFLSAEFDVAHHLTGPFRMGLSAVIEEVDGTKSYWALTHPPGAPDFHHPDCFALHIPALAKP